MEKPLDMTFRHMDPSPAVEASIREKADELIAVSAERIYRFLSFAARA